MATSCSRVNYDVSLRPEPGDYNCSHLRPQQNLINLALSNFDAILTCLHHFCFVASFTSVSRFLAYVSKPPLAAEKQQFGSSVSSYRAVLLLSISTTVTHCKNPPPIFRPSKGENVDRKRQLQRLSNEASRDVEVCTSQVTGHGGRPAIPCMVHCTEIFDACAA